MHAHPPPTQALVAVPGVVAVIDSVGAGGIAGVVALGLDLGTAAALILGTVFFVISLIGFISFAMWTFAGWKTEIDSLFPTPPRDA